MFEKLKYNQVLIMDIKSNEEISFQAYDGNDHYIYISYAHLDRNMVFPDIEMFHSKGYKIWYDQGIAQGFGNPEDMENALSNSSLVVVFISRNSVSSHNVLREIDLALTKKIPVLPIFLEETELPPNLMFSLGMARSVLKFVMSDEDYIEFCTSAFQDYGL
jgi:hypothetical protein